VKDENHPHIPEYGYDYHVFGLKPARSVQQMRWGQGASSAGAGNVLRRLAAEHKERLVGARHHPGHKSLFTGTFQLKAPIREQHHLHKRTT
jgi:hypothetical protein